MDKGLKRTIGFVKPKGETSKVAPKKKESTPEKKGVPEKDKTSHDTAAESEKQVDMPKVESGGKKLVLWLSEREFINRSALCKAANVDRGNFDKYMKIGEFPEKIANPIVKQLKKYGYESI